MSWDAGFNLPGMTPETLAVRAWWQTEQFAKLWSPNNEMQAVISAESQAERLTVAFRSGLDAGRDIERTHLRREFERVMLGRGGEVTERRRRNA